MLSKAAFAQQVDGPALDREIERLVKKGGGWIDVARVMSRRVNGTADWESLGPMGSRYRVVASRGEAVLFWDNHRSGTIVKLRGLEENGFLGAGFGCILARNERGQIEYAPGTLQQALDRETLTWEYLGFGCVMDDVIEGQCGLLLSQKFINGSAPLERDIHRYMIEHGWESLQTASDVSPTLRRHAWKRGNVGAFDANETNFIVSDTDGELYPIDLIVGPWPS